MSTGGTPQVTSRVLTFENGTAIGLSNRWAAGRYCSILTPSGIVGCGIYDLRNSQEFGQAIAVAQGSPDSPPAEPEDLLEAEIVGVTDQAAEMGIEVGMTGRQAVELMLQAHAGGGDE